MDHARSLDQSRGSSQRFLSDPSRQRKELPFPARLCIRVDSHSHFHAVHLVSGSCLAAACRSRIVLAFVYGRSFWHRRRGLARQSLIHQPGEEVREGNDIFADTRFFESVHVGVAVGYRNDRPRVCTRGHHRVHQEAPDAAVAIHIRMDVDEGEVPEHHADGRVRLFPLQVEEGRHGVPHRVPVQRHLHRLADIDLAVPAAREIGRLQQADGDAGGERLSIPRAVVRVRDLSRFFPSRILPRLFCTA